MNELIAAELERRKALWEEMKRISGGNVPADKVSLAFVRQNDIYHPQAGTYVDQARTLPLTEDEIGATTSIRLKKSRYQNEISDDWAQFEYPKTSQPAADRSRVQASINAKELDLPIFVIIGGRTNIDGVSTYDRINLGWVFKFKESQGKILVKLGEKKPSPEKAIPPRLTKLKESEKEEFVKVRARPNQPKFSFDVKDYYGEKCAVCDVSHKNLLDAAHIVAKAERGIDSVLNGLVLCKNHHAAFDNYLFGINPESKKLVFLSKETAEEINISQKKLETETGEMPHEKALRWKWRRFQKVLKEANQ